MHGCWKKNNVLFLSLIHYITEITQAYWKNSKTYDFITQAAVISKSFQIKNRFRGNIAVCQSAKDADCNEIFQQFLENSQIQWVSCKAKSIWAEDSITSGDLAIRLQLIEKALCTCCQFVKHRRWNSFTIIKVKV